MELTGAVIFHFIDGRVKAGRVRLVGEPWKKQNIYITRFADSESVC